MRRYHAIGGVIRKGSEGRGSTKAGEGEGREGME